jgi:hypothetical protein
MKGSPFFLSNSQFQNQLSSFSFLGGDFEKSAKIKS